MAANESSKYTHFSNVEIGTASGGGGLKIAGTAVTASAAELNLLDGVTATTTELNYVDVTTIGTVQASKAVVVDANKDASEFRNLTATNVIVGVGGTINSDSGTATATAGAATLSKMAGVITSEALTTAAGAEYTLTVTNTGVAAADIVLCSVANGTNTTASPSITTVTPGAGSFVVKVLNENTASALNGTIKISFLVIKA